MKGKLQLLGAFNCRGTVKKVDTKSLINLINLINPSIPSIKYMFSLKINKHVHLAEVKKTLAHFFLKLFGVRKV